MGMPPPVEEATIVKTLLAHALLAVLAVLVAGLYRVVHNQISYTVSPEYITRFKFRQFGLVDTPLPGRDRAAMVGFLASWWMGIPIGLLVSAAGFIHRGYRRMFRVSLWSLAIVVAFALLFGLCGLLYGYSKTAAINPADYRNWFMPDDVVNLRRFLCAGHMHNSSYLGSVLGIVVGWIFHVAVRFRTKVEAH